MNCWRRSFIFLVGAWLGGCSHPQTTAPQNSPNELLSGNTKAAATTTVLLEEKKMPTKKLTETSAQAFTDEQLKKIEEKLVAKHGAKQKERIRLGLKQAAQRWREVDGSLADFEQLALTHFYVDEKILDDTAKRLEYAFEMLDGHAQEVRRELSRFLELDEEVARPVDQLLAAYSPFAHHDEDMFRGKIAFVALLNFPLTTLEQRLKIAEQMSRPDWAMTRLTERFAFRLPAEIAQNLSSVSTAASNYIDNYNVYVGKLAVAGQHGFFPPEMKLISHWGLRDEIRAQYGQKDGQGLNRQRLLARVMERIIAQEIPASVVNNPQAVWDPFANQVQTADGKKWAAAPAEAGTRYATLLSVFRAEKLADPYFPELPTHIDRVFQKDREMPEARVKALLESVLSSPLAKQVGAVISKRLGRPLEPFDIWYAGFKPRSSLDERELDKISKAKYPTVAAFQKDIPRLLQKLGFARDTARYLAERIVVDPARGAGHATEAKLRAGQAHLRTRVVKDGLDYKGFNIAAHEMGHNVEQVFSISKIDHTLLQGVPNTAFTEAFAFLFQARDIELLGKKINDPLLQTYKILDRFWSAYEISGVALVDAGIWHWMYEHPEATPQQTRDAIISIAKDVWNKYFAPVFGVRDQTLLAIYSHIIAYELYTPDYALGFLITSQIEQFMQGKNLGTEMERMCRLGRLAPDVWMKQAVGSPVTSKPLLEATTSALKALK